MPTAFLQGQGWDSALPAQQNALMSPTLRAAPRAEGVFGHCASRGFPDAKCQKAFKAHQLWLEDQVLHSDPFLHMGLYSRIPVLARDTKTAAGGGLTISRYSGVHRGFLSLSFCGCFQLLFQPADITVCLGLHDAQLRVDVFVLVAGVFLILAREQEQPAGARQTAGAEGFVDALKRSLANADRRRAGSGREAWPGQPTHPLGAASNSDPGDRQRAESQGPAHSAARACSPSATGLLVAFHFSQDTGFKQNSQEWPWLVQSKPVPPLRGWADL